MALRAYHGGMRGQAPTLGDIEDLARAALARIPAPFAEHLSGIVLVVEEFADEATLDALEIDDPFELTGLYHGRPLGEKALASGDLPDRIHLYRRALLDEWCATGVRLDALVSHVVVHEVGHHFGLSDEAMAALEAAAGGEGAA